MICANCQKENREGSRFCQFCGTPIAAPVEEPVPMAEPVVEPVAEEVIQEVVAPVEVPVEIPAEEPVAAPVEEPVPMAEPVVEPTPEPVPVAIPAIEEVPAKPKKEKKAKKEKKEKKAKGKKPVFLIILSIFMTLLFLASAGLNVYQYYQQKDLVKENEIAVHNLETEISGLTQEKEAVEQKLRDANDEKNNLLSNMEEMSAAMNEQAPVLDAYARLASSVLSGAFGYYSEEFYSDYYSVYVAPGEEVTIKLYTVWEGQGTVTIGTDSNFATAEFTEQTWEAETNIKITGVKEGMSIITFTWDGDKSFDIVVFVEE